MWIAREKRSKVCKASFDTAPTKGFCASQNLHFYGYMHQGVCYANWVFHSIELTKANIHDTTFLRAFNTQLSDCVLLVDKGYLSPSLRLDFFKTANIKLETPWEPIKKITRNRIGPLEKHVRESKPFFLNSVVNSWSEGIMPSPLMGLKQEYSPKSPHYQWCNPSIHFNLKDQSII